MTKSVVILLGGMAMLLACWVGYALRENQVRAAGFDRVVLGAGRNEVLAALGTPDHAEPGWSAFMAYANEPCSAPCAVRLWWENALLPHGFEAWSVDFDQRGNVMHKAHWVSP